MEPLSSPLRTAFRDFIDGLERRCVICSPYISMGPVRQLIRVVDEKGLQHRLGLKVLTDISLPTLLVGATDINALILLMDSVTQTEILYLPRIHAKVFISDETTAIVGSANFTNGGLSENLEYAIRLTGPSAKSCTGPCRHGSAGLQPAYLGQRGVFQPRAMLTRAPGNASIFPDGPLTDPTYIRRVATDIEQYGRLGSKVDGPRLRQLSQKIVDLRNALSDQQQAIDQGLRQASEELQLRTEEELLRVRIAGRTVHAIFSETIEYVLQHHELTTEEIHQRVREIHPDLCDDIVDRVIDGERFGKLWKHQVRTAQQHLKRTGRIAYNETTRLWHKPR